MSEKQARIHVERANGRMIALNINFGSFSLLAHAGSVLGPTNLQYSLVKICRVVLNFMLLYVFIYDMY